MKTKLLLHVFLCCALILTLGILGGCGKGDTGSAGKDGQDLTATAKPESCAVCHRDAGSNHQAAYNELYQDGVIVVSALTYTNDGANDIVTFEMTKNGANFDCTQADSIGIYFTEWDGTQFPSDASIKGTLTYDAGVCTSTKAQSANGDLSALNGLIVLYGADETVEYISAKHMRRAKYPFAAIIETNGAVNYASTANVAGCEKCHTRPFLKHAYIYGSVDGKEFFTCKACHYDTRTGKHPSWQLLVDDPARFAALNELATAATDTLHDSIEENMTTAELAQYAYNARLMNDVHMSHSMEFAYPQSMANCATCHEGKLASILTQDNFNLTTCRSCHPVTAADGTSSKRAPALKSIMPASHGASILDNLYADTADPDCTGCHGDATSRSFSDLHTGYNSEIYADAAGTKYSDAITVTIDSASLLSSALTITFSANESPDIAGVAAANITPTVMVGLYGYDTKDFLVGSHGRTIDSDRDLEYVVGATHARFTTVSKPTNTAAATGTWVVTADLSAWADKIADGSVKRAEIAVTPGLDHPTLTTLNRYGNVVPVQVALNAPSRTFDLVNNVFVDYFSPIVDVANGCNSCHDALATTFHSANRGGNITVCRMCHVVGNGGSHLEMQSRSIDSYVHAIHSFQPFDIGDINFADPVEAIHVEHHTETAYPTFGITNCESCHNAGTYNVPDQSKSLPGVLSAADTVQTKDRNIGAVPSYVTGPASRACGSCHRAELINEDNAGGLAAFNEHTAANGYMLETATGVLDTVIETIMSIFE